MMMDFLFCFGSGLLLGILFYGGLWLTLVKMVSVRHPGLLVASSFLVRLALVGVGMFFLTNQGLGCLGAGFLGFLSVRILLTLPEARREDGGPQS
ncbi:MAG: ATP synthase subunit I [Gemmatimonadota bacterium]